jgi:hypothetical protein
MSDHNSTPAFGRADPVAPENFVLPKLLWEEMPNPNQLCCTCRSGEHMELVRNQLVQAQIPVHHVDGLVIVVGKAELEKRFPELFEGRAL